MAGGLGNQLFQFSAAKLVAQLGSLELVYGVYPVRKLEDGSEVFEFKENFGFRIHRGEGYSNLLRKLLNYSLRRSSIPTQNHLDKEILQLLLTFVTWLTSGRFEKFFINNGLGWDERISSVRQETTLIGYFQSHRIGSAGIDALRQIVDQIPVPNIFLNQHNNVMVHIRLTDYLTSDSLGHLEDQYYVNALRALKISQAKHYKIFTDGTKDELLVRYKFADVSRVVDTINLNSWQILKSMSSSKHFIIANSSFSWWSAQLSDDPSKQVIAPKMWFTKNSPVGVHNPYWTLI